MLRIRTFRVGLWAYQSLSMLAASLATCSPRFRESFSWQDPNHTGLWSEAHDAKTLIVFAAKSIPSQSLGFQGTIPPLDIAYVGALPSASCRPEIGSDWRGLFVLACGVAWLRHGSAKSDSLLEANTVSGGLVFGALDTCCFVIRTCPASTWTLRRILGACGSLLVAVAIFLAD